MGYIDKTRKAVARLPEPFDAARVKVCMKDMGLSGIQISKALYDLCEFGELLKARDYSRPGYPNRYTRTRQFDYFHVSPAVKAERAVEAMGRLEHWINQVESQCA